MPAKAPAKRTAAKKSAPKDTTNGHGRYGGSTPLRERREALGVSRKTVADAMGVKLATAWAIETGQREATAPEVKAWDAALRKLSTAKTTRSTKD